MTRVLVVDDEAPIRRAMAANLRARGYDVDLAETGEQALQLAARHHPDVVLLDLGLPGMDGLAVIDGLRGWTQVPIVVLSARGSERDKVAALDAGADDYVSKPFGMDELLARLRAAVRRATAGPTTRRPSRTDDFTVDLAAKQVLDAAGAPSTSRRSSGSCSRCSCATAASSSASASCCRRCGVPATARRPTTSACTWPTSAASSNPTAPAPRYLLTEPGMGYRFVE